MRRLALSIIAVVGPVWGLFGCAERIAFDRWIAQQPITVKYQPVPCNTPIFRCGQLGGFDSAHNILYFDPIAIASEQNTMNSIDPTLDVRTMVWYHEWGHVADRATGFQMEGSTALGFEHAAQCVMQLVTGRSYNFLGDPFVYWLCPAAELARARWILTAYRIIA